MLKTSCTCTTLKAILCSIQDKRSSPFLSLEYVLGIFLNFGHTGRATISSVLTVKRYRHESPVVEGLTHVDHMGVCRP